MAYQSSNRTNLFLNTKKDINKWEPERLKHLGDFLQKMGLMKEGARAKLQVSGHKIEVDIANTPELRSLGLMKRLSLDENAGMIFVFEDSQPRSFWMKETYIPLSIAYLDSDGVIINIENMSPLDLRSTRSSSPAKYALEMNEGWFESNGIQPGDTISINSSLGCIKEMKQNEQLLRKVISSIMAENFVSHSIEPVIGDLVKNNNTGCKHYQSEGEVLDIKDLNDDMGKIIVYRVSNSGDAYSPGDILEKTLDQLTSANKDI